MLGILLIYFIGKSFYKLAETHKRHPWGMAIAGIAVYYGAQFLVGALLGVFMELNSPGSFDELSEFSLIVLSLITGLLGVLGLYTFLKNKWSKQVFTNDPDILDDDIFIDS